MAAIDYIIVAAYFAVTLAVGLRLAKRAQGGTEDFFLSGRSLPWWLAGTSMVATTFAADTPLAITEITASEGIAGNWIWWGLLPGGLATVFFFAALWRRARVVTDVELIALRYSGAPARALRSFRAVYYGLLINAIIIGWVNIAIVTIVKGLIPDLDSTVILVGAMAMTLLYSTLSGLWGVAVTDVLQFIVGMTGTIALAWFGWQAVGGLQGLTEALASAPHPAEPHQAYGDSSDIFAFLPDGGVSWHLPLKAFAVFLCVNWWASWYPGSEPGGGGYIAQRMFACKNERHATLAGLWFNVANFALRPWPWIIAGLCAIALYSNVALDAANAVDPSAAAGADLLNSENQPDAKQFYVRLMVDHLPSGWLGIAVAAFFAAYMSTISTQLNWGASYLVNDLYRPLVSKDKELSAKTQVRLAQVATLAILAVGAAVTVQLESIAQAWKFLIAMGAGTGLVLILRWYWWRINAWSEISSMVAALGTSLFLMQQGYDFDDKNEYADVLLITLGVTTAVWLIVTFLTDPEPQSKLTAFHGRVRPGGPGWRAVAGADTPPLHAIPRIAAWVGALALTYGVLFGLGSILLGATTQGILLFSIAMTGGFVLAFALRHPCFAGNDDE